MGFSRGSVSEMLLIVGSLLASLIIIIAAWQLITFQASIAQAGKLEGVARDISKNINFVQQISNPYELRYSVGENANLSIKNGIVRVSSANSSASFPHIGAAENSDLIIFQGQQLCISNNAGSTGVPSVKTC